LNGFFVVHKNLISIIMPVRDTEKYLPQCINSIIQQQHENWELISVNDGSTDSSLSILYSYAEKDPRIKVFDNANHGLINALRLGFDRSKGKLLTRMDSDDIMPSNKISLMLKHWLQYEKGSLITGGVKYFAEEEKLGDGFIRYAEWLNDLMKTESFRSNLYKECVIPSCCWLVHREDFVKIGGFESNVFPEDYDLCFRFVYGGLKITPVDGILHHWRDRSDRISRTQEVYRDNRFLDLKLDYFLRYERETDRPLVVWGAGKNGKDLIKKLQEREQNFDWVCQNEKKIGKAIYNLVLQDASEVFSKDRPQIIIAVASPEEQKKIRDLLKAKTEGMDYWFFL
jgi:glycosyltransferase involved in cell wall biosynthesis